MSDIRMPGYDLLLGDCLERLAEVPDATVDLVLCDLPYGTTACKWDNVIPFQPLWEHYWRVLKPNGAILLFAGQPFTSALVMSQIEHYRYNWVWNKRKAANFLFGNKQPLKKTEDICVFYRKQPTYNAQRIPRQGPAKKSGARKGFGSTIHEHLDHLPSSKRDGKSFDPNTDLPTNIIEFAEEFSFEVLEFSKDAKPVHPTQKPVALLEYLVRTYTNEGDLVLDNTMGSGSTGVAAVSSKRRFIGIERESKYFDIAADRIGEAESTSLVDLAAEGALHGKAV